MTNLLKRALLAIMLAFSFADLPQANAQPGLGDFDGDGLSDLAYSNSDKEDGATSIRVRLSSNPGTLQRYRFNVAGDAFITGKFYNDARTFPGVVRVTDINEPLLWVIKFPAADSVRFRFGIPGDTIPNQGDVDCDGKTDIITTRKGNSSFFPGFRIWFAALSSGQVVQTVFGQANDSIAVGDVDGDGCDELIALRPSNFLWFSRKFLEAQELTDTVQWGLPGDIPLLPKDMNGDSVPDYIVARRMGDKQIAFIRYNASQAAVAELGPADSIPMTGKFFQSGNTFAWVDRDAKQGTIQAPDLAKTTFTFANSDVYLNRPDGTVIPPGDSGRVGSTTTNGGSDDDDDGGDVSGICNRKLNPVDGRSSGITYNPDNSRGKPKIIMPSEYNSGVRSVNLFQGTRRVAGCDRATPNEHGNRPRWYCNISVSSTPMKVTFVINRNGRNDCVPIPNPRQRYD